MMRRFYFPFLLVLCIICGCSQDETKSPVEMTLFYSKHCHACHEVREDFLPGLLEKCKDSITLIEYSTNEKENLDLLKTLVKIYNREKPFVPTIVIEDFFLVGKTEITEHLEEAILKVLKKQDIHSTP